MKFGPKGENWNRYPNVLHVNQRPTEAASYAVSDIKLQSNRRTYPVSIPTSSMTNNGSAAYWHFQDFNTDTYLNTMAYGSETYPHAFRYHQTHQPYYTSTASANSKYENVLAIAYNTEYSPTSVNDSNGRSIRSMKASVDPHHLLLPTRNHVRNENMSHYNQRRLTEAGSFAVSDINLHSNRRTYPVSITTSSMTNNGSAAYWHFQDFNTDTYLNTMAGGSETMNHVRNENSGANYARSQTCIHQMTTPTIDVSNGIWDLLNKFPKHPPFIDDLAHVSIRGNQSASTANMSEESATIKSQTAVAQLNYPTDADASKFQVGIQTIAQALSCAKGKACTNCGETITPQWRYGNDGKRYCNACGIYLIKYGVNRSLNRPISKQLSTISNIHADSVCSTCQATVTSQWRYNREGETICNACYNHYRLHNEPRPVEMRTDVIRRRNRGPMRNLSNIASPSPPKFDVTHSNRNTTWSTVANPSMYGWSSSTNQPSFTYIDAPNRFRGASRMTRVPVETTSIGNHAISQDHRSPFKMS